MTAALLDAAFDTGLEVVHVDTSDRRSVDNIGKFDHVNVVLALRHAAEFVRSLLRTRPEIVYLPLSQSVAGFARDAVFLLLARLSAAQVVVHAHGGQYQQFYRRMPAAVRGFMRFSLARVHLIIVLAEAQRRQFDGWAPQSARVEVIPNGVRDEWPTGAPQRLPNDRGTVLVLGNLLPEKGFMDVLDAVPTVLSAVPGARFVFAGSPPRDAATVALVRGRLSESTVEAATTFAGVVGAAERRRLLEAADILVFAPRWSEGQGLVALEAMSAGLPLVATSSGWLAEMVRDGKEAIIVPSEDPQAIAAAVTRLLQDSALRARMGTAARARFESEYTLDQWNDRMRQLFEAVSSRGA